MAEHKELRLQELIDQLVVLRDQVGPDAPLITHIDTLIAPVVGAVVFSSYSSDGLTGYGVNVCAIEGKRL